MICIDIYIYIFIYLFLYMILYIIQSSFTFVMRVLLGVQTFIQIRLFGLSQKKQVTCTLAIPLQFKHS